jgi:hypothetical protein
MKTGGYIPLISPEDMLSPSQCKHLVATLELWVGTLDSKQAVSRTLLELPRRLGGKRLQSPVSSLGAISSAITCRKLQILSRVTLRNEHYRPQSTLECLKAV